MAIEHNPLNKFSTYNYIWFLDVASAQEQASGAYKNKRGRIARSGGIADTAGSNLQTLDERNLGVKGEYFIDNVKIDAVVSPNPYSGIAFATNIEFEITEPYSIGLFLQTLQLAAEEADFENYLEASFVLGVEFTGYDSNGSVSTIEKKVLLIKFMKIDFSVTAAGSVYRVEAISWNHQALLDQATKIPVNISIKGDTVEEILTSLEETINIGFGEGEVDPGLARAANISQEDTGKRSLIKALNDHEKSLSANGRVTPTEYEILFPTDPSNRGSRNDFANQKIAEGFEDLGNLDHALPDRVYDQLNSLFERRRIEIEENGRVYQFPQGTKIEKIIEEVILTSEWVSDITNLEPDNDGYVEWFKILTFVETIGNRRDRDRFGSRPKKFIYMVYPYKVHASVLASTNQEINYNTNVRNAVRGYNYTYTGENTDILEFNIEINYAWIQAVANLTQSSTAFRDPGQTFLFREQVASLVEQGVDRPLAEAVIREQGVISNSAGTTNTFTNYIGNSTDDDQTRIARAFNDAIVNSNANLIMIKMTIWGDPYYLADSDYGGYVSQRFRQNQGSDRAMDHIRSEVDVLLKFAGAVDYKNNLLMPNTARQFSGVFKLYRVSSTFESGVFKQELELVRRINQDSTTIDNVINAVDSKATGSEPFLRPSSSGISGNQLDLFLRQAEQAELLFSIFGQLKLQDLTSFLNVTPFGLISQLSNFNQLFDQVRQIRSAIGNLGSLAGNINIAGLNSQSLQQLSQELTSVQDFFGRAFSEIDVSSISQVLNQNLSNLPGQLQGLTGQLQGLPGQLQGLTGQLQNLPNQLGGLFPQITAQGAQGTNTPTAPPLPGLSSIVRPQPRPQTSNPLSTRLIDTPAGPRRVVVGDRSTTTTTTTINFTGPQ
jgi:predicted transcriptional regulator with HTH domain